MQDLLYQLCVCVLQGTVQLVQLLQSQKSSSLAMSILSDGLQRLPPVIPPLPLLTDVATSGGVVSTTQDLFPVVTTLVRRHIAVSCGPIRNMCVYREGVLFFLLLLFSILSWS